MKIPIEKERLFRILQDLDYGGSAQWNLANKYSDNKAVQVLADLGFVILKTPFGMIIKNFDQTELTVEVHLKDEFLTQVGLALFREHDENTD